MPGADGMSSKFMKNAFVGWTFTAGLYYPPDFDQSKLMPMKHLRPKGPQLMNIRMMFPFTMVCDNCHEYNYTGTKFTAKVEHIKQESYLGIKVYRFYGRCRHCWSEFTFKTDPKNSDYTMESGGKRTYEAWKDADMMENQLKEERQKEAEQDPMKALEQKSIDVQAEMQRLEDLDAIRTVNKRMGARDQTIEEALEFLFQREEKQAALEHDYMPEGDVAEMRAFKEAQEERKRKQLEDKVDGIDEEDGEAAAGSSSGLTGAGLTGAGLTGGSSSSSSTALPTTTSTTTANAAIASAVAERAKEAAAASSRPTVGARFSIKRKVPEKEETSVAQTGAGEEPATKRPNTAATSATAAAEEDKPGSQTCAPMGLLGGYDSDSSH